MEKYVSRVTEPIGRLLECTNVDTIFGKPVRDEVVSVVPVAHVRTGFGFGYGGSRGPDEAEKAEEIGGGGAGYGSVQPIGYITIMPEGTRFEPTVNGAAIALSGIALAAWIFFVVARTVQAFAKKK